MEKATKQQQQFKKSIHSVLKDFERNKEWADIGNWLYKLEQLVKSQPFQKLPEKLIVGKRLAQCLNPNLPPGVHGTALRIYEHLFNNCTQRDDLYSTLSMGLFPFFENSSFQLKFEVLKIIEKFYIDTVEVLPLIVALVNSIICGLNENHEELTKKIFSIFDKLSSFIGKKWVDGAIWVNILKSPKTRIAGFKYLQKVFKDREKEKNNKKAENKQPKSQQEAPISPEKDNNKEGQANSPSVVTNTTVQEGLTLKQQMTKNIFSFKHLDDASTRFPNTSCLVVNALLVCLSEGQLLVQRSALDLMISYIRLDEKFLKNQDREILTQACLHLLMKKEFQLTRRIFTYLFGQPDTDGKYIIDQNSNSAIRIIEKAFFRVLEQHEKSVIEAPVLILQYLFREQELLMPHMLPNVSYPLMRYIYKNSRRDSAQMEKPVLHFLTLINQQLVLFVDSVVDKLDPSLDQNAVEIVKILEFFFFTLIKQKQQLLSKEMSTDVLERLIASIHTVMQQLDNYSFVQPALELSNKLKVQFGAQVSEKCVSHIEDIANCGPAEYIYAGLMHLHPNPPHSFLLPHIEGGALSLVSLTLLMDSPFPIDPQQLERVFVSLMRLLDCHLWQDQAIVLIKKFEQKFPDVYARQIENSDISQWLTYWKRLNGDIKGAGVIRMLRFLDDENPLKKHTSQNWLLQSMQIISKILEPVFQILNDPLNSAQHFEMLKLLKNIMINSDRSLGIFIFSQRQRFLDPLLTRIQSYLGTEADTKLKSHGIEFCTFLLGHVLPEQKTQWIQVTFKPMLESLDGCIKTADYLREIQVLSYLYTVIREMPALTKAKITFSEYLQLDIFLKIILNGLSQAKISYVKSQYIKFLTELGDVLLAVLPNKKIVASLINIILERYSHLLRQIDVGKLQQIIQGKRVMDRNRKLSGDRTNTESIRGRALSQDQNFKSVQSSDNLIRELNVQNKYSDTINLWNAIKYYIDFSITQELEEFRIQSLLSLILNSFPFSYLIFRKYDPQTMKEVTKQVNEEIRSVSGLKKEVLEIFDILWKKHHRAILTLIIEMSDPRILVHASLDPQLVVASIYESSILKQILAYHRNSKLSLPKNTIHYNRDTLQAENKLMYFLYLYLSYANIKLCKSKIRFWENTITVLKTIYQSTPHIQIKIWIFETLALLYQRVIVTKELVLETKYKNEGQELLKSLVDDLAGIIARNQQITHKTQIKTGLKGLFSKEEKDNRLFDVLKIFPPTMSQMEREYAENKHDFNFSIEERLLSSCFDLDEEKFKRSLAVICSRTLSRQLNGLLQHCYENDMVKIVHLVKELLAVILPVCEDKSEENQIQIELVSEVLYNLVNSHARLEILKAMKRSIFQIYMGNDFFKCTKRTLSYWKDIINSASELEDLLSQLLSKETILAGLFTGKAESTRLKIKSFERICFLIYAGRVDQYETRLKVLLESLNDVMKEGETSHPALLILILFCIRIMIIRLSPLVLNKMFRTIWPSFMTLLLQLFEKKKQIRNPNLILAALKSVELIHAMELEEFHHQRWMFFYDYFGIHIQPMSPENTEKNPETFMTPFENTPLLMSLLPRGSYVCDFIPVMYEKEELSTTYETAMRKMVIKQPSVDNENELRNHAFLLVQHLINTNQKKVKPNKEAIEGIIEADFISLDDYIFDIK